MTNLLDDIEAIFIRSGGEQYSGEPVTQLQHALQTAQLAEEDGGNDEMVTAALLHDLGHLLENAGPSPTLRGVDDRHQFRVRSFLGAAVGERVLRSIEMHVDAKRYLCAARPDYWASLSPDSKRSLTLQGGVFDMKRAEQFICRRFAENAVQLRLWDDLAKQPDLETPPLKHYLEHVQRCMLSPD